jgi:hypothetical protein
MPNIVSATTLVCFMQKRFSFVRGYMQCYAKLVKNTPVVINERRQKLWACLSRGMKGYEIAKELRVDSATVSRDIKYLTAQSQNYLNSLARETLPFMYQTSIEGIRDVIKEAWSI